MTKVEQVARALMIARGSDVVTTDDEWPRFLASSRTTTNPEWYADLHVAMRDARAAIAAMDPPTEGMIDAGQRAWERENLWTDTWRAMVAAALEEGT